MMNRIKSRFVKYSSTALALLITLLTTLLLAPSGASAKGPKVKGSGNQAEVVAHMSFAGLSVVDMAMQRKANGKYYLYVQHSGDHGISIIDIAKPAQPKAVGVIPWPDPALSSRINVIGALAIIAENGVLPMRSNTHDDLVLWDLSNPAAPRVVQKFSGVVKWLQDERNFIYVLNGEGLWVVSKPADRQPEQTESLNNYGG
jgi:hypothetical protein